MKVMSYNIQHGEGMDEKVSLSRIADNILKFDACIVGVQEVDKFYSERSQYQDQGKKLAVLLKYNYVFGANLNLPSINDRKENREYGTAIFSRFPIIDSENIFLTSFGEEQRSLLRAKIDVNGTYINVYNTHLGLDQKSRKKQIAEIIEITSMDKEPHILLGDFNAEPTSEELLLIQDNSDFKNAFKSNSHAYTYSSINPIEQIDYIFVSQQVTYKNSEVLQVDGSDHLPIVTDIIF